MFTAGYTYDAFLTYSSEDYEQKPFLEKSNHETRENGRFLEVKTYQYKYVTVNPSNGTVTVNPVTGEVTYTPDPNYVGTDTFEYQVCDNEGLCDTATVTVVVNPVNDAPVATDDNATTNEDTPVVIDVTANDTDTDGTIDPTTVV
ncbi:cadherin-like domain-containing protein, partial [Flavobacterium sp. NRK F10]|uniref:Ig-like domain-containing protein n=1 Tax=Flavobacterium sp. NRK F10 TaxID=2954931 RepID=UPI0020913F15